MSPQPLPVAAFHCAARSRKFRSSAWPCSEAMLSGWNCTPWIGRCCGARPMIRPSSVSAVTRAPRQARSLDDQRMIARRVEGRGQAGEHAAAVMGDGDRPCRASAPARGRPCRRRPGRSPDGRGRRRAAARALGAAADQLEADAGLVRGAGAGRQDDARPRPRFSAAPRGSCRCAPPASRRPVRPGTGRGCR